MSKNLLFLKIDNLILIPKTFVVDSNLILLSDVINPWLPTPQKKPKIAGRPEGEFSQVSPQTQKARLDPAYKKLEDICETQNLAFSVALGKIGARYYHHINHNDLALRRLFVVIANGVNPLERKVIDEQTSLSIREALGIGQSDWDLLRKQLEPAASITARSSLQNYAKGKI